MAPPTDPYHANPAQNASHIYSIAFSPRSYRSSNGSELTFEFPKNVIALLNVQILLFPGFVFSYFVSTVKRLPRDNRTGNKNRTR